MADLSIILVTFNPGDLVIRCLQSVSEDAAGLDAEIIVVDNASHDGTPERIAEAFSGMRLIRNTENRGFAAANNQALAQATGDFILLLNPDVVVQAGALHAMIKGLTAHPQAGIVGARMLDGAGHVALTAYPAYTVGTILWQYLGFDRVFLYHVFGRYRRACEQAGEPFRVAWVQGSCLMLRREVYEQVGGLDEGLFLFTEEPDYCERALRAGWETIYLPGAVVTHYASSSVARYDALRVRHYHLSPLHYFRKRGKEGAVLALKVGFSVELGVKIGVRLAQAVFSRSEGVTSRLRAYRAALGAVWCY